MFKVTPQTFIIYIIFPTKLPFTAFAELPLTYQFIFQAGESIQPVLTPVVTTLNFTAILP